MFDFVSRRAALHLLPAVALLLAAGNASAVGECGLSCCLASSNSSGVTLAQTLGLALQYENSDMESILHGSDELDPVEVIDRFWTMGGSFAVPTSMTMEKLSLIAVKPIGARWQMLGIVPYVRNNMDMLMKSPMGMLMPMEMDTVQGLGDITAMALFTAYTDAPVRPTRRLTLGFGVKAPTGDNDERTASGRFVHAMMQTGSGSWDGLFSINYMRAFYPLVIQASAFYHLATEGDEGYEFGDQIGIDLLARYQVANYVNLGLGVHAIHAGKDEDHDGKFSHPMMSLVDNVANTGLTSVMLTPGVQIKIPNSGGSLDLSYQTPIYQHVNGYQQVVDGRWLATLVWAW